MDLKTLEGLERLNQLKLTEAEEQDVLNFFATRDAETAELAAIPTENVERMVHVMPMVNVLREDVIVKKFELDDLLAGAPESMDGYWQVPMTLN